MMTKPPVVERPVQCFRLRSVVNRNEVIADSDLDEQTDPQCLDFSKLSGYHEWEVVAEFEGGYAAPIVTCNWQSGAYFIAHGEYHFWHDTDDRIETHEQIIPYVKRWLTRAELYGVLRIGDAIACPHLEIFGGFT